MTRLTVILVLAVAASCGGEGGGGSDEVSFARHIRPIFLGKCTTCHYPGSAIGYDLTDPFDPDTGIVGRENSWVPEGADETLVVDPGNVENSSLILKVAEPELDIHVDGNPMPYQVERLTEAEVADVEQWIADGANDDQFFADNVAPLFGTEITLRRQSGKCTWCHFPGSQTGLSVLDVFDPDEGMVGVDSIYGGKIVAPGDPAASVLVAKLKGEAGVGDRMPLHYSRLTSEKVQLLRDWIEAGAPNN